MIEFHELYLDYSDREPARFKRDRVSKLAAAFPDVDSKVIEDYLMMVWLELGLLFESEPFTYEQYLQLFQKPINKLMLTGDKDELLNKAALFQEHSS